jgi:hypothetical protein
LHEGKHQSDDVGNHIAVLELPGLFAVLGDLIIRLIFIILSSSFLRRGLIRFAFGESFQGGEVLGRSRYLEGLDDRRREIDFTLLIIFEVLRAVLLV